MGCISILFIEVNKWFFNTHLYEVSTEWSYER